ncbi:hypothetical protein [Aeoliella sp.]|uniref:hypothetical protein n=1 Tax=Aeoliella sp. TaxID=2795800 RepID=UPI003CCBB3BC
MAAIDALSELHWALTIQDEVARQSAVINLQSAITDHRIKTETLITDEVLEEIEVAIVGKLPELSIEFEPRIFSDPFRMELPMTTAHQAVLWAVVGADQVVGMEINPERHRSGLERLAWKELRRAFEKTICHIATKLGSRIRTEAGLAIQRAEVARDNQGTEAVLLGLPLAPQVEGNEVVFDGTRYSGLSPSQVDIHRVLAAGAGEWVPMKIEDRPIYRAAALIDGMPAPLREVIEQEPPQGRRRYNPKLVRFDSAQQ